MTIQLVVVMHEKRTLIWLQLFPYFVLAFGICLGFSWHLEKCANAWEVGEKTVGTSSICLRMLVSDEGK